MSDVKKVVILGTGGSSVDILDTVNEINLRESACRYECVGFLDDNEKLHGQRIWGVSVLGPVSMATELDDCCFVNGIGTPTNFHKKEAIIGKTGVPLERFATIVHPTASVSRMATLGYGVVILQNVSVTANVKIGNHVIILPNSIVSHDVSIGDFTCVTGGVCISGNVTVGRACYLGTNSTIVGGIEIQEFSLVGMGSVVLESVTRNSVVVGSPARFLRPVFP